MSRKIKILLGIAAAILLFLGALFIPKKDPHLEVHPSWMVEQIAEDLTPFRGKNLSESDLEKLFLDTPPRRGLLYVSMKKGVPTFSHGPCPGRGTRLKIVKNFFISLSKKYKLPNVFLLVSLEDAADDHTEPVPLFVFAKDKKAQYNILFPDFEALRMKKKISLWNRFSKLYPWEQKKETVFWRGANTGIPLYENDPFSLPRFSLVALSSQHPLRFDAAFTTFSQWDEEVGKQMVALTKPLSSHVPIKDHFQYKYLIDIDGNSCTYERCRWILLSNSTLLKQESSNIQWYYKALIPFVHYVPLKRGLEDLQEVYAWLQMHEDKAKSIAEAGSALGQEIFSPSMIDEYVATLLSQYENLFLHKEGKNAP